ncbi:MAG: TolB family protein [Mongoliitalea sp.]
MSIALNNRFFGLIVGISFLFTVASCEEHWDDPIPEGVSLARATLLSELTDDGNILLMWGNFRICNGWRCVQEAEASSYDLFVKWPNSQNFERLVRLSRGTSQYLVDNVRKGKPYEFFIRSNLAGVQVDSNTVMIVPGKSPEIESIFDSGLGPHGILHPSLSPSGDQIAYVSDVRFAENGEERRALSLFVFDQLTQENRLVRRNANHPNWSSDGKRLIYSVGAGSDQIPQGIRPTHLEIYNLNTEEFSLFSGGLHQQAVPSFSNDDQEVFFYADSLASGDFGIWKRDFSGVVTPVFTSFDDGVNLVTNQAVFRGLDVSRINAMVVADHLQLFNDLPVYHIFGFDMSRGRLKVEVLVSQWNDYAPSLSPVDPYKMAFVSDRSGTPQIWILDMLTGAVKQVTFFEVTQLGMRVSEFGITISWTDNGRSLVFPVSNSGGTRTLVKASLID